MSASPPFSCPHCGAEIPIAFTRFAGLRSPLTCPSCQGLSHFPFKARAVGIFAGIVAGCIPLLWLRPWLVSGSSEPMAILLKLASFVLLGAVMLVVTAAVCRGLTDRLIKFQWIWGKGSNK